MTDVLGRYRRMIAAPTILAVDPSALLRDMATEIERLRSAPSRARGPAMTIPEQAKPSEFDRIRALLVRYASRLQDKNEEPPGQFLIAHAFLQAVEMLDLLASRASLLGVQRPEDAARAAASEIIRQAREVYKKWRGDGAWIAMEKTYLEKITQALATASPQRAESWQTIENEPSDDSEIWISNGKTVWLGTAHKDGSLKLPSRSECKFWRPANKPAPPVAEPIVADEQTPEAK